MPVFFKLRSAKIWELNATTRDYFDTYLVI